MDRFYKMMKRNNRGFTLVELMVVLLILGILVAIAIPIYNKTQASAQERACQANLRTIDGAIAQYMSEIGEVPASLSVADLVTGGFLKEAPKHPKSGEAYKVEKVEENSKTIGWKAKCPLKDPHTY
jgi:type II secretion system protein G